MAAITRNPDAKLTKDCESVSRIEAYQHQWNFIYEWEPTKDVWFLKFGPPVLAFLTGFIGLNVHRFYRNKLKCNKYGFLTSAVGSAIIPSLATGLFHRTVVSSEIITGGAQCYICTELKGIFVQCLFGLAYPFILSPIACYTVANLYSTARFPNLKEQPKEFLKHHIKLSKMLYRNIPIYLAAAVFSSTIVTYLEYKEFSEVSEKMEKIETEMKARGVIFD